VQSCLDGPMTCLMYSAVFFSAPMDAKWLRVAGIMAVATAALVWAAQTAAPMAAPALQIGQQNILMLLEVMAMLFPGGEVGCRDALFLF
jgi:hypothetical protein